ncbi:SAM-dependent methyltransferase [Actinomadura barringtoniae]|uniref:SAM-dependent methyltransferase n=1 Tax=Actinomadura barringtoniae TaxID=1427535 RepID=A0A939PKZ4_9ACTN|nr:SAM-dependent methyltransferase [Actinomadura barringtoniae]MBO2454250.1 SAM-dependent methyltransferase [Actinomadura barringtoniae]
MSDEKPGDARPPAIDTGTAHPARIWNYWLGGKDNYPIDREIGDQTLAVYPEIVDLARQQRAFLGRVVRHLAGEAGVRQFLDIGTGLPTADNTHEVAQRIAPESRIVYVDNDPLVLVHARALLTSTPEGATDYIDSDLRDPERIVTEAARTLDFTRPIAITMLGVLIFISDDDEAAAIMKHLVDALPPGSYLALTHTTNAVHGARTDEAVRVWNEGGSVPMVVRSPEMIEGFFGGLELLDPGLGPLTRWRPDGPAGEAVDEFCAVGKKPQG